MALWGSYTFVPRVYETYYERSVVGGFLPRIIDGLKSAEGEYSFEQLHPLQS